MEHPITPWTTGRKGTPKAVYVIGGWNGKERVLSLLRFDLRAQAWVEHPAKLYLAVARIGSYVYAVGGWTPEGATASMERLDITKPMSIVRVYFAAASIKGVPLRAGRR